MFLLEMLMPCSWRRPSVHDDLKEGRVYVIEIPYHKFTQYNGDRYTAFGKGIYKGEYSKGVSDYYLWDVTVYLRNTNITFTGDDDRELRVLSLNKSNQFYDFEEIRENAQKARHQMEERALNKILKELVNEEFEW
jgi:hypothetical protein